MYFSGFCDCHQDVIQEYKQHTNNRTKLRSPDVTVNILSAPCGHKISNYVIVTNR